MMKKLTKDGVQYMFGVIRKEIDALRAAGQQEYAHKDQEPFRNFEKDAADLNIPREKSLMMFARKHLNGIYAWMNGHKSQRENVRGRINDALVYLMLLRCMIEEDEEYGGLSSEDLNGLYEAMGHVVHKVTLRSPVIEIFTGPAPKATGSPGQHTMLGGQCLTCKVRCPVHHDGVPDDRCCCKDPCPGPAKSVVP